MIDKGSVGKVLEGRGRRLSEVIYGRRFVANDIFHNTLLLTT
jgi:hypothetical protein